MTQGDGKGRRAQPRIERIQLVHVSRFDEEGFRADMSTGRTLNISRGGVRLELDHALPLNSIVSLTLVLEDDLIDVTGHVVYLESLDGSRCAMGIEFSELSREADRTLCSFLGQRAG